MKRNGFTLVELLIVITIIVVMAVMMIGILNAIGIQNKARDAQRKKDLNRIKIAFEEYYNDNGHYPPSWVVSDLIKKSNCGSSSVFAPYLTPWPCDPNGKGYAIRTSSDNRNVFTVGAVLENKKDKDIHVPSWANKINYGVSSSNILWYDLPASPDPLSTLRLSTYLPGNL